MNIKNKIITWYDGLPLNKNLKTGILMVATLGITVTTIYFGYQYGKKIIIKPKKDNDNGNEQGTVKTNA